MQPISRIFTGVLLSAASTLGVAQNTYIDEAQARELLGNIDSEQAVEIGMTELDATVVVTRTASADHIADSADGVSVAIKQGEIDTEQAEVLIGTPGTMDTPSGGLKRVGFVWANNPSSAIYTPSAAYTYNASGQPVSITRSAVGTYAVRFAGLGGPPAGGNVQVTGYGSDSSHCKVRWWSSLAADFVASIICLRQDGSAVDARYTVLVNRAKS